jgi:hypothetical protein
VAITHLGLAWRLRVITSRRCRLSVEVGPNYRGGNQIRAIRDCPQSHGDDSAALVAAGGLTVVGVDFVVMLTIDVRRPAPVCAANVVGVKGVVLEPERKRARRVRADNPVSWAVSSQRQQLSKKPTCGAALSPKNGIDPATSRSNRL